MRLRDTALTATVVVVFAGTILATAASASTDSEDLSVPEQAERLEETRGIEYTVAAENPDIYQEAISAFPYPLPDSTTWPDELSSGLTDPNMIYEDHSVETAISLYWMCSWSHSTLAAADADDAEAVAEGIGQLGEFRTLPFLDLEGGDEWYAAVVAPLSEGNFEPLRSTTPASCGL